MPQPAIITVAITGAIPRKVDTPAVPVTPSEQIESTHEAFEAGASVVHIHVRDPDESPSSDPTLFAQVQEGVSKHCPGMIIQFSTGGRGREQSERGKMLYLAPDMASLATGSVNFPNQIYENPPQLVEELARTMLTYNVKPEIEVFDLAMLYNAKVLADRGLLARPCHVQFVMGIPNALPARRNLLEFLVSELKELMSDATWAATGIGRHQLEVKSAPDWRTTSSLTVPVLPAATRSLCHAWPACARHMRDTRQLQWKLDGYCNCRPHRSATAKHSGRKNAVGKNTR